MRTWRLDQECLKHNEKRPAAGRTVCRRGDRFNRGIWQILIGYDCNVASCIVRGMRGRVFGTLELANFGAPRLVLFGVAVIVPVANAHSRWHDHERGDAQKYDAAKSDGREPRGHIRSIPRLKHRNNATLAGEE